MEYIDGENLEEYMQSLRMKNLKFDEPKACHFIKQLLLAICHMHGLKIVHRDVKPANIMLQGKDQIKLIDFGLAKRMKSNESLQLGAGTASYMAPEIFEGKYDYRCDMWAVGCILYEFICDKVTFDHKKPKVVHQRIKDCKYDRDHPKLKGSSAEVQDLINKLIEKDPEKRLSAVDALQHPWFQNMEQ